MPPPAPVPPACPAVPPSRPTGQPGVPARGPELGPAQAPDPRARGVGFDRLCGVAMRPRVLTNLIRDLLVAHFADPANVEEEALRAVIWTPPAGGRLSIEKSATLTPGKGSARPAIVIKRNRFPIERFNVGDVADVQLNHTTYAVGLSGTHTVTCWGDTEDQAEVLAQEAARHLVQFAPVVREAFGLRDFRPLELGEPFADDAAPGVGVPVPVFSQFQDVWQLRPEARRLRQVEFRSLLGG